MKNKILEFIKEKPILSTVIICAVVALVISVTASLIIGAVMKKDNSRPDDSSDEIQRTVEWGKGITEGIPEFKGNMEDSKSTGAFAAVYYINVTGEQVKDYIALVESQCGITFSNESGYPRSAIYGEKLIAIHYNVTEMQMSVTITKNENNIHSGE
jgi:hypothetical protein